MVDVVPRSDINEFLSDTINNGKSKRSRLCYCVCHSAIQIITTCSIAKDNIYFAIIILQLLPNLIFHSFVTCDTVPSGSD